MSKNKAKLVTVFMFVMTVLMLADLVAIYPAALPWVLGVFAIPGAWKFCQVLFLWLTTEDKPVAIKLPLRKKEKPVRTYKDYAAGRFTE